MINNKREQFRVKIRRGQQELEFKKKRIIVSEVEPETPLIQVVLAYMAVDNIDFKDVYMALIEEDLLDEILILFRQSTHKLTLYHILNEFLTIPGITKTFLLDLNFNMIDIVFNDLKDPKVWNSAMTMVHNWLCEDDEDIFDLVTKDNILIKIIRSQSHIDLLEYHQLLSQICVKCPENYDLSLIAEEIARQNPIYRELMLTAYIIVKKQDSIDIYTTALKQIDRYPDLSLMILIKIRNPDIMHYFAAEWPLTQMLMQQLKSRDDQVRQLTLSLIQRILYFETKFNILIFIPLIINECRRQTTNAIKLLGSIFYIMPDEQLFVEIIRMVDLYNIQLCEEILFFVTQVCKHDQASSRYEQLLKDNIIYIESITNTDNDTLQKEAENLVNNYAII